MASLINSSGASGSGSMTIQGPNTNSTQTLTIPDATGTIMVSGNMPAFSAYQSSAQTLSSNTLTKIQFQSKDYDTANAFDSTTNYRFTPQVAGYYVINATFQASALFTTGNAQIFRNGSAYMYGTATGGITGTTGTFTVSGQIYLNGSTDYVEIYGIVSNGQALSTGASTRFQGLMVRAA